MPEIEVLTVSPEEAFDGIAELWMDGVQLAYTDFDDGRLVLCIHPSRDGSPVVVGAHSLADALDEVDRVLSIP